jgi:hypothetical protein
MATATMTWPSSADSIYPLHCVQSAIVERLTLEGVAFDQVIRAAIRRGLLSSTAILFLGLGM